MALRGHLHRLYRGQIKNPGHTEMTGISIMNSFKRKLLFYNFNSLCKRLSSGNNIQQVHSGRLIAEINFVGILR
jgi:hypothetical protein